MTKDEALKLALRALERLACLGNGVMRGNSIGNQIAIDALTAIKDVLAQPEQEPVQTIPSFTQLQQIIKNLEHCLSRDSKQEFLRVWIRDWTEHKLSQNTTPPQRTWVGLTDIDYAGLPLEQVGLVRWAEAKLKEKNT